MKLIFLLIILLSSNICSAAFCGPENEGSQTYDLGNIQICTQSTWNPLNASNSGKVCTIDETGKQRKYLNELEFCNGSVWMKIISCAPTSSTCTVNGAQRFDLLNSKMLYCNGSFWIILNGTCTNYASCTEHTNISSCNSDSDCLWNTFCFNKQASCFKYQTALQCNTDTGCSWVGNGCTNSGSI